jgi:hypothetical protein
MLCGDSLSNVISWKMNVEDEWAIALIQRFLIESATGFDRWVDE